MEAYFRTGMLLNTLNAYIANVNIANLLKECLLNIFIRGYFFLSIYNLLNINSLKTKYNFKKYFSL